MLLALLSDTHDDVANTQAAIELLRSHKPDAYLHAGDMVSPSMLDLFDGLPFYFVFGNNEYDFAGLRSRAIARGLHCLDHFGDLTFGNARIGLTHGHNSLFEKALRAGHYQYLIHGHTHLRRDDRAGSTRIINPGAVHRARKKTVALLNVTTDELRFLELPAA